MAAVSATLPAPRRSYDVFSDGPSAQTVAAAAAAAAVTRGAPVPPYGRRQGFIPKCQADFGDGGAYPEIHVAQFPLDMGRPGRAAASTAIVPVTSDGRTGEARFDAIIAAQHPDKKLHTRFNDLIERRADVVVRMRPSPEEEVAAAASTKAVLEQIVDAKIRSTRPGHIAETAQSRAEESKYIRYTPAPDAPGYNPATAQRVIRMVEAPIDPFEPSKFKHKKVPGGPPDAPVPVMRSPPRKVTAADQEAWKIPPAISNWKNTKGYIVPLDKRLAVDGRSMLEPTISDGFAKLSESLIIAERKARAEVETRAAIQRKLSMKDKEAKEEELRALAARARMERTGVVQLDGGAAPSRLPAAFAAGGPGADLDEQLDSDEPVRGGARAAAADLLGNAVRGGGGGGGYGGDRDEDGGDAEGAEARERLRAERKREREKDLRLEAAGGKRGRLARDEDRDITERVALGQHVGRTGPAAGGEAIYDTRLFNQTSGVGGGLGAEDDYNVYSKPWRTDTSAAAAGYRPRASADGELSAEAAEEQMRKLQDVSRFRASTDFEGVEHSGAGAAAGAGGGRAAGAPVQFEKDASDPFGIDTMLHDAKRGSALDRIGRSGGHGFMSAAAGGASSADELAMGGSGRDRMAFQEAREHAGRR